MIDKILNKDKKYNSYVAKVKEKENQIENVQQDIAELEKQLTKLKNDILVKEVGEKKKAEPVSITIIEDEEKKKIEEETILKIEFAKLQEKHKDISLIYEKVIENIKVLSKDQLSINIQAKTETIPITEKTEPNQDDENPQDNNINYNNNTDNANEQDTKVETQMVAPVKNLTGEEEKMHSSFGDFLAACLKKFEILFLCHSKKEFLNLMRQKGFEFAYTIDAPRVPSKLKQKKTLRMKTEPDNIEDYDALDPTILMTEKNEQTMIFNSFLTGMRNKKEEFTKIKKEK